MCPDVHVCVCLSVAVSVSVSLCLCVSVCVFCSCDFRGTGKCKTATPSCPPPASLAPCEKTPFQLPTNLNCAPEPVPMDTDPHLLTKMCGPHRRLHVPGCVCSGPSSGSGTKTTTPRFCFVQLVFSSSLWAKTTLNIHRTLMQFLRVCLSRVNVWNWGPKNKLLWFGY